MDEKDEQIDPSQPAETGIAEGVEEEVKESGAQIFKPFDPMLIRVESKPMTLGQLITRMQHDEIDLAPDFQRRAGLWKEEAQSRLVESLLIRIPIPAFYFDASDEDRWIVVDGLQRLTALRRFIITEELRLCGMEFLDNLNGKLYKDLQRQFQRRIDEAQIVVFLIEKNTPAEVKFNIFKRINTGGIPLTAQEIRHALNQGPVTGFLAELANSDEFLRATNWKVRAQRMDDRECVVRFMAFVLTHPEDYKADDFDSFLSDAMARINRMNEDERQDLKRRFLRSMRVARALFNTGAFRKHASKSYPINKALFETWSVSLDAISDDGVMKLQEKKTELIAQFGKLSEDFKFNEAISQGTGDPVKVRRRFASIRNAIQEVLNA